ncbi:unnamed protein product [Ostreobium quekettii]|uniref:Uncharacterized protein n=1 Tax=Ostreobium quekettii TaxID=121088 RepID=A0A8S1J3Q9_9CHLO|nr:unnamed protein product [Ostreobium quekettii]
MLMGLQVQKLRKMAPRVPILLKEVVYTLSPFEQSVTSGLWRDFSYKVTKQIQEVSKFESALIHEVSRFCCALGRSNHLLDSLWSYNATDETEFESPSLREAHVAYRQQPMKRLAMKAALANELEAKGTHEASDAAMALRMEMLGLAKIHGSILRLDGHGSWRFLLPVTHFHLGRRYFEACLYKQAAYHATRQHRDVSEPLHRLLGSSMLQLKSLDAATAMWHFEQAMDNSGPEGIEPAVNVQAAICNKALGLKSLHKARVLKKKLQELEENNEQINRSASSFPDASYACMQAKGKRARLAREMKQTHKQEKFQSDAAAENFECGVDRLMEAITAMESTGQTVAEKQQVSAVVANLYRLCSEVMMALAETKAFVGDHKGSAGILGEVLSIHTAYGAIPPNMLAEVLKKRTTNFLELARLNDALEAIEELLRVLNEAAKHPETRGSGGELGKARRTRAKAEARRTEQMILEARDLRDDIVNQLQALENN